MKHKRIREICTLLMFLFLLISCAHAQDNEEEIITNPQTLLKTADEEIFKRSPFVFDFSEDQGYVNEFPNPLTLHQYYIYDGEGSDVLMTMQPSTEAVRTTNKRLKFEQIRGRDFHATYTVVRRENIPVRSGGNCWIRYSNVLVRGEGRESGLFFVPGDSAYSFAPVDGEIKYEDIADLSDLKPDQTNAFDFIRLDGTVHVFVNGKFRFSFNDGITDPVSFESGSELNIEGTRVRCAFDDFSMRVR